MSVKTGKREQWDFEGAIRVAVDAKILGKDYDFRSQPVSLDFLLLACCPEVLVFKGTDYSSIPVEFSLLVAPYLPKYLVFLIMIK